MSVPCENSNKCLYFSITVINVVIVVGIILLVIQTLNKEVKKTDMENWKTDLRLSPNIYPIEYDLLLHPKMDFAVFSGHVDILLDIKGLQSFIALHIKGLNITTSRIITVCNDPHEIRITDAFEYQNHEFWVIIPERKLHHGRYKLQLDFNGQLADKIVGFYNSQYLDENGKSRLIVTSKFEPTFARQAFPCFDEPSFKSKFNIKLVRPSNEYIALSNMNLQEEVENSPDVGETTAIFSTSVPMSTYLVCFIVCDFKHLNSSVSRGMFPITVYARKNEINNMQYANEVAIEVINYYCEYFRIPYPLPKLDLIAIPDFVSGAMENWGLITFRETSILYNNKITSAKGQFRVALTVAHELAHMWFGNLVTMKWWNDLWLNEGYATFMEYKAVSKKHPDWNLDAMFLIYDLHPVLELDSILSSHPIVHDVTNPDQITEIFDTISYNKGASIIRMLEATIGEENFRKGIQSYLMNFIYGNAETKDLWNHMQQYGGEYNITTFMNTWTLQMGYPLITVSRTDQTVTFKQERYLTDPNTTYDKDESPFKYKWEVPITFITSLNSHPELVWLHHDKESVSITLPKNTTWLKVNYHQTGYYRVNYDLSEWYNLIEMSPDSFQDLPVADRANLLNDAFNLANAEIIAYDIPLKLSNFLQYEDDTVPWVVAQNEFLSLRNKLQETPAYNSSAIYVQNLLTAKVDDIWSITEGSSFLERYLQTTLFKLGCSVGHPEFVIQAKQMFLQQLKNVDRSIRASPDLSESIYYYGIQNTEADEWNKLWGIFIAEQSPQDKLKLMVGLTASNNVNILEQYLVMAKNESYVRSQDYLILLINMATNPVGSAIVWNFVRNEWPFLVNRYTINDRYLGQMIVSVTKNFATEERLKEMKDFFAKYPDAGAGTASRKQALEKLELNIKWREKHVKKLNEWFQKSVIV